MPDSDFEKIRTNMLAEMEEMYLRSLRAMDAELTELLEFTFEFKGERSSERLSKAQESIREEIKENGKSAHNV